MEDGVNVRDGPISVLLIPSESAHFAPDQSVGSLLELTSNILLTCSLLSITMAAITSSQILTARPRVALKTTASSRTSPVKVRHEAARHITAPVPLVGRDSRLRTCMAFPGMSSAESAL